MYEFYSFFIGVLRKIEKGLEPEFMSFIHFELDWKVFRIILSNILPGLVMKLNNLK